MTNEHISFSSPFPSALSNDGKDRVRDFLARHGGRALDRYRLQCEWAALGSERQMSFVEIVPGLAIISNTGNRSERGTRSGEQEYSEPL
jgi:hypothetical protein